MSEPTDLRKVNRPWGPVTRAIEVNISSEDFIDLKGFQFFSNTGGTLMVRLLNSDPDDPDLEITITAGVMASLGQKDAFFRKVASNSSIGTIIVCYQ